MSSFIFLVVRRQIHTEWPDSFFGYASVIRGVLWNARKSMWKIYFSRDGKCLIFLKCQKFEHFQFLSLFCSNSHHVLFFWNARFSYVRLFWNAHFSNKNESKIGHFKIIEHMKIGHFKKSTWWEFEQKRERNWKCLNFGHFKKYAYAITWK